MLKTICFKWMNYMLSELYLNKLSCFKVIDFITAFSGILAFADTCPQLLPIPFKFLNMGQRKEFSYWHQIHSYIFYFAQFSNSPIRYNTDYLE